VMPDGILSPDTAPGKYGQDYPDYPDNEGGH